MNFLDHTLPEISKGYLDLLALLSVKLAEQNRLLEKNQPQNEALLSKIMALEKNQVQTETLLSRITALENNFAATQQNSSALTKNPPAAPPPVEKNTTPLLQLGKILKDDGLEMVVIAAGSFIMGGNNADDEKPPHTVNIKCFAMGKTPVTQKQWKAVMGSNPSHFTKNGDNCPVENISWEDSLQFIQKLNAKTGNMYRLPSEAEWEYAARAGGTGQWFFGDDESQLEQYAWYDKNSDNRTHPVAQKRANAFGLFDVHGNVLEWVEDVWHDSYSGAPTDGSAWTSGGNQSRRVLRGGSWYYSSDSALAANRYCDAPRGRDAISGFRLARTC